jgi:hypothetical protein
MHNLSDGVAYVGIRSRPRAYTVDPNYAMLRTDDGNAYVAVNATTHEIRAANNGAPINVLSSGSGGAVNVTTNNGNINLNGVTIDPSGNINCPATVTATTDVVGGGKHLKTHTHSGVQPGSGTSGPPS